MSNKRINLKTVVGLVAVAAFLYLVLPHLGDFRISFRLLKQLRLNWLIGAVLAALGTYCLASGVYIVLAKHKLKYWPTLVVQCAGLFANRLVPAGLGALGINYDYLRKHRHSVAEAGGVVAANNLIGIIGHLVLLGLVIIFVPFKVAPKVLPHLSAETGWVAVIVVAGLAIVLAWSRQLRHKVVKTGLSVARNLGRYRAHPGRLALALVLSMGLTLLYLTCLVCCCRALNLNLAFGQILIVMSLGVVSGTVTPTPGGLVGAEAGLLAGLTAYGAPAALGLAVVLIYRLITYWLALILGFIAFLVGQKLGYL